MSFSLRMLFGFCVKDWWGFSVAIMVMNVWSQGIGMSQWVLRKWKQRLQVSLPWNSKESRERRQCPLGEAQDMGLVLKCSTDPSAEWEGDSADGLQLPGSHDTQTREFLNGRCLFCPRHIQSARFCTCVFKSQPEVSKKTKACSGQKRHFPDLGLLTISYQQVPLPPAPTLRVPQPIVAHLEGWHQGVDWKKSPPFKLPPFLPVPSALPGYNNTGPFNKMVNSKARGGNGRPSPCDWTS